MLATEIKDALLAPFVSNTDRMFLCNAAPTNYTQASTTYMVGYKDSPTVSAAEAGTGNARKVHISAVTDGVVNAGGGNAAFVAYANSANSFLQAVHALASNKALVAGTPWTCNQFDAVIVDEA